MGSSQRRSELFSSGGIAGVGRREAATEGDSCRIVCEGSDASEKLSLGGRRGSSPRPGTQTGKADTVGVERREVDLHVLPVNVGWTVGTET